jgi:ribosomal protein S27E
MRMQMKELFDKYVQKPVSFKDLNSEAIWIKCRNCGKLFTQTVYKGKKSVPICPYCKTINK